MNEEKRNKMLNKLDFMLSIYTSLMMDKRNELKRICDEIKVLKFCKKIAEGENRT